MCPQVCVNAHSTPGGLLDPIAAAAGNEALRSPRPNTRMPTQHTHTHSTPGGLLDLVVAALEDEASLIQVVRVGDRATGGLRWCLYVHVCCVCCVVRTNCDASVWFGVYIRVGDRATGDLWAHKLFGKRVNVVRTAVH